ncbi:UdgX family uracil-DNA binding protein [Rhizobiales bacterium RZME27]|uniref:Type-4 uracil-DNA glycosylase n=1 Tax=Endobacterium cereale TaxID=2663029 RepID=A0A6A8AIU1_9HYPH|nr:UdgX family uracil-DNA binding protein [Endobacterium cereale]MEB2843115.1 UdgX family uracil-DNA binding protein [Endobacterium cereale]MQY49630.1 UdgX family uracil-DNA binding protein [Endobacterium cereale]
MTETCFLEGRGDLAEWRDAARRFLMSGIEPKNIDWRLRDEVQGLFDTGAVSASNEVGLEVGVGKGSQVSVSPTFLRLAEAVVCHSDPGRFALLYRLLCRLKDERHLLEVKSDADVVAAHLMHKSVGRDYHKMTAFVRFKEMSLPAGVVGRRRFFAWFEPDHFIVARVAPFFQRRFTDMDWIIATPRGSASWDGESLRMSSAPAQKPDISDETEELWRTYYASIFNPARLKVKMMMTEMPKKYWKNLPEADLIPGLIAGAEAQVLDMGRKQASEPLAFHHRLQEAAARIPAAPVAEAGTIEALREEARHCSRCDLHCRATQTVFGEGPVDARVMIVGEQPGDQEDLAGRPFVGPAGRVFDEALSLSGLDRRRLYVTNAVKHFKYEPRGKRRIHQRPNMGEVQQCRWWLTREIDLVKPKLIVAMGATALFSLTDRKDRLQDVRGRPIVMDEGRTLFVTVHPSYLLRIPDESRRAEELEQFRDDISRIGRFVA